MIPGIARDPYLREVADGFGEEAVWEAGYFDDGDPGDAPLDDVGWLCTPTAALRQQLHGIDRSARPVVLLATGAFFPPHAGHLSMMEAARGAVESTGRRVVGGYLSPGHDDYLRLKWGAAAPPASDRVARLWEFVADSPWLAVDPWEAQHRRVAVNFTDVTARLEAFLRHHVDPRLDVVYVCGGDNARFALAFVRRGGCVVVGRPGREDEFERWRSDARVARSGRVLFVPGDHDGASSTMGTPERASSSVRRCLRLRMEDARAVVGTGVSEDRWQEFQRRLVERLSAVVDVTRVPMPQTVSSPRPTGRTISLDPMVDGDVDVGLSRCFELGGARQLGHVTRPGWPPVADVVGGLAGSWRIVDDDVVTGGTLAALRELLPATVEVVDEVAAMRPGTGDIGDSRDFLLGSCDGGLVVALPDGSIGRTPYLLPYVDPAIRCAIDPEGALALSHDLWLLNAWAFEPSGSRVSDLPPAARATMRLAGHHADELLVDVCHRHAATLAGLQARPASSST